MKYLRIFKKSVIKIILPYFSKIKSDYRKSQFRTILFLMIILLCAISAWLVKANAIHNARLQEGIAENIIRFHVIANSDSTEDQALKLKVKDKLVAELSPLLRNADSIAEARLILSQRLDFIHEIAKTAIQQYGYHYPVKVTLEDCYFPLKVYGDCSFPPGIYNALRVQIGAAEGKNWWCVMFPPLCFVDETYSIVDENSDQQLKHVLTQEEYATIKAEKKPVKVKFKLWDSIKKIFT